MCLVSYFGMVRKSHLLDIASSMSSFYPAQQLVRSDFQFFSWRVLMTLRWSRTVQFQEWVVQLPLSLIPERPLCPVIVIQQAFSFIHNAPQQYQAFMWWDPASLKCMVLLILNSSGGFMKILHTLGLSVRDYASHSF